MFWRFGFHNASAIEGIIEKEDAKLDDIMKEEELLQEVKSQNAKLLEFLCKPINLSTLLKYITENDALDDQKKFKYPYIASEVFGCEVMAIIDALFANKDILAQFWTFLDSPAPLNPIHASYFTKINGVLLSKKTGQMMEFLKETESTSARLLNNLSCHAITDLILKIINVEESPDGAGTLKWLRDEGLIAKLYSQLDPKLDSDVHTIASQTLIDIITLTYQNLDPTQPEIQRTATGGNNNILLVEMKSRKLLEQLMGYMLTRDQPPAQCTSSLASGIMVIMELIRRYCSEIETAEMQHHEYTIQFQNTTSPPPFQGMEKIISLSTDLNDLFAVFCENLEKFAFALNHPLSVVGEVDTTVGKQIPLGTERLKICELFAEFIHLQYLFTSSPLFDIMVYHDNSAENTATVADGLILVTENFIKQKILENCIKLFFNFPWNNFIHSVVYDMIAKIFNTYSFTANLAPPMGKSVTTSANDIANEEVQNKVGIEQIDHSTFSQNKMNLVRRSVKKLVVSIFTSGSLIDQITNAQRLNDFNVESPKGYRLGYMGHLTYISDEACKLFEKCGAELDDEIHDIMVSEDWHEYVNHALKHTQDLDRQPLGGTRPEQLAPSPGFSANPGQFGGVDDDFKLKGAQPTSATSELKDIDDAVADRSVHQDAVDDQFARFLCQQLVKDLPDRFMGADSSDEEEDRRWIGDLDDKDVEFDIGEAIAQDSLFPHKFSRDGDEETVSDDMSFTQDVEIINNISPFPADSMGQEGIPEIQDKIPSAGEFEGWADFSKLSINQTPSSNNNGQEVEENERGSSIVWPAIPE
ncbi:SIT4 phosphatase-associated protein-domain-containing protein [Globomyces pollinis-pini]|nr:SIT4 phosphatase-associated protein-domain-containing protein [Globomyces pollinis-pini]